MRSVNPPRVGVDINSVQLSTLCTGWVVVFVCAKKYLSRNSWLSRRWLTDYQLQDDPMLCLLLPWRTSVWGVWRRSSSRPARGRPSPGPAPGPRPGARCSPPQRPGPQSGQGRPQSKHRHTLALIALIEHFNQAPNIYNYKFWIMFKYNQFLKTALTGTKTGILLATEIHV